MNEAYVTQVFGNDYTENTTSEEDSDKLMQEETKIFSDVTNSSKNSLAIQYLKDNGIIGGYADGSFKAQNSLNRAELLKILVEGIGNRPDANIYKNCFPDVKEEWYAKYICFAKEKNWISGYADGTFKPANNINKVEAMKMLLKTFDASMITAYLNPFDDVDKNEWFGEYVNTAKLLGFLEETTQYWPSAEITRGQISENIYRAILIKDFGYERQLFAFATLEDICYLNANTGFTDGQIGLKEKNILKKYGFDVSNDTKMLELITKYADDAEINSWVEAESKSC